MIAEARFYDPFDVSMHVESYPGELYRWMRREQPLYRSEEHDFWALSRFSDVQAASRDWEAFSSAGPRGVDLDGTGSAVYGSGNFIELDPPRHDVLRDIVRRAFTPRGVAELEAAVREEARSRCALLHAAGGGEIYTELCWPLAFNALMRLLGVPEADRPYVDRMLLRASVRSPGETELPGDVVNAAEELRAYMTELVRGAGVLAPGILRQVAAARASGLLTEAEAPGIAMLLMFAGVEAPAIFAANALVLLAEHQDQRELLRAGRVESAAAVEELIRYEPAVQALARTTTRPVSLHGVELPAGATVVLLYGAANRDERRWEEPDALDFGRPRQRNVAFGEGLHFCLGAALTRLEAKAVVESALAEGPEYSLDGPVTRTVKWCDWGVLRATVAW